MGFLVLLRKNTVIDMGNVTSLFMVSDNTADLFWGEYKPLRSINSICGIADGLFRVGYEPLHSVIVILLERSIHTLLKLCL